ncbi:glucosylceramidase-like [Ceratina calcarata]|uniref:Glucosylceramidase n=1 Tax=Ceratina calcarata TaxID=156304 RepID=A0AAJ7ISV3_9HYME|nr:glucosylceramidase-like [Ceratina calcarata]XP_017875585.1 glucosylceramidase-like [Ceratina calcarata]
MWLKWLTALLLIAFFVNQGNATFYVCAPRSFGPDQIVCVCNSTYCDTTPNNRTLIPPPGSFSQYTSSRSGLRMQLNLNASMSNSCRGAPSGAVALRVNTSQTYQTILGFGGAFTDSNGINILSLSPATQSNLLASLFHPVTGNSYNLGRVPIGGTDFSLRPYTLDDIAGDYTLSQFSLAPEDLQYKIPIIQQALRLAPNLLLDSAAWSAPPWMKSNGQINGFGFLLPQFYQTYADYILQFLAAYASNGINIWAVSTGNEPLDAYYPLSIINSMGWSPSTVANWVVNNLGPTLANSTYNNTQILAIDDQRIVLPSAVQQMFDVPGVEDYIAGIAVHWYDDSFVPPDVLDQTHNDFPNKFILMNEACAGSSIFDYPKVILGSWERAEQYALSMIQYFNNWSVGWMDWNFALDMVGGPNWIKNFVDALIIVNADNDEFYKQPMFYAVKHFSRFVERGSVRIGITNPPGDVISTTAFLTPQREVVVVVYNRNQTETPITINEPNAGTICVTLPPQSLTTITFGQ